MKKMLPNRTSLKTHEYIIVANGDFLPKEIILETSKEKIMIALDGAANRLARIGIIPHIILGDFDSIALPTTYQVDWGIKKTFTDLQEDDLPYRGKNNILIVPAKNQMLTDLEKAIAYCDANHAQSISIICALGGRLDHHEGAIRLLRKKYNRHRSITLYTAQQTVRFAQDEMIILTGKVGDSCGILAYPTGTFTSHGLTYDVHNYPLEFASSESISNTLQQPTATVTIAGEALIIMPPQFHSQREFTLKNETEQ